MKYRYYYGIQRRIIFKTAGRACRRMGFTTNQYPVYDNVALWERDFVRVPNTLIILMRLLDDEL
jgi:hypothetical protein